MNQTKFYLCVAFMLCTSLVFSQKFTISGYIEDASSKEKLIAANVFDAKSGKGAVTNTYGFYSLTIDADSVYLSGSYIGYNAVEHRFLLKSDTTINFLLSDDIALATVEVTAERGNKIEEKTQMSQMEVPVEQIKKLPSLLGEVDVFKVLQLLPGVQSGGEGTSGLYVRGGSPDQNLVLLDGVPVYNVSHVLGIFSVFNADAIKNVTLTKGGFPARYGGRLSSVIEINMKEGNMEEFEGEGSVGIVSSKLTLQGPIAKGKTSFLVSGRRTYADLVAGPFIKKFQDDIDKFKLNFYDLNAKIQHKFNDKHRLFLSGYSGQDVFNIQYTEEDEVYGGGLDWDNKIAALRWNWQLNPRLFSNTTLTYSRYTFNVGSEYQEKFGDMPETFSSKYKSGIEDFSAKIDFDFIPTPDHYIRFGASATHHTYSPGALALKIEVAGANLDTLIGSADETAIEYDLYVEDDFSIGPLKANVGLHASGFDVNDKLYTSLQPRVGLNLLLPRDVALKASYASMVQYINLLTSEALALPADLWVPSTDRIEPQRSWQVALGAAKTINDEYEVSLEGFYKEMKNVVSYKEGASFLSGFNDDWQDKVTQGDGQAYGLEFFLQKKKGKTTGWIGYTLSYNWRQFDEINGGRRYPFRYDRRHDASLTVSHQFTDRISASLAWVYGTGNAFTLPRYRYPVTPQETYTWGGTTYVFPGQEVTVTGEKNSFRMSNYHRLDVSVDFTKKKKRFERKWTIGAYNAYNHVNPYFVLATNDAQYNDQGEFIGSERVVKEFGILPIIPAVSYSFKF